MPVGVEAQANHNGLGDPQPRRIAGLDMKWWVLISVGTASFIGGLDSSIVSVILPVMRHELGASVAAIEWVMTIYLLIMSGVLLPFGRLGDLQGQKRIYTFGFIIFGLSSAVCGVAWNAPLLICARGMQAVGGGILYSSSPALVTRHFPSAQRGQAMGLQATMVYFSLMVGPVVGGWITDHFGWRYVFYINIPICLAAIALTSYVLPHDKPEVEGEGFDYAGAVLFLSGLVALILALNQGHAWGWLSTPTLGLLGGAVALMLVFIWFEGRTRQPMLDLTLFHRRRFATTSFSALMNYFCVNTVVFLMPFYLIQGRSMSPSMAGLVLAAQPAVMMIFAPIAGTLSDRLGARGLASVGMALQGCGLVMASRLASTSPVSHIVVAMATIGLGTGLFVAPNNSTLMGSAPPNRRGIAGGVLATARNSGMVLGVGFAGAVFTTFLAHGAPTALFDGVRAGLGFGAVGALAGCLASLVKARPGDEEEDWD